VFVFNFHPHNSYSDWRIPVPDKTDYKIVLNSDDKEFDGSGLADNSVTFVNQAVPWDGRQQSIQIYVPARSVQVLAPTNLL